MPSFGFVPFPTSLHERYRPSFEHDFWEKLLHAAFAPDGSLVALGYTFYNAYRYGLPEDREFTATYATTLAPDLELRSQVVLALEESDKPTSVVITPHGEPIVTCDNNAAIVLGDAPRRFMLGKLASYAGDKLTVVVRMSTGGSYGGMQEFSSVDGEFALASGTLDALTAVAMIRQNPADEFALTKCAGPQLRGELTGTAILDTPAAARLGARTGWFWMRGLAAFDGGALLAVLSSRGGKREPYCYLIVDDAGRAVATLAIGTTSPYEKVHLDAFVDHVHRRIVWRSAKALHAFELDGTPIGTVGFDTPACKPLAALQLAGVSPRGGLLLWHPKQRWLALTDPIAEWKSAARVLAETAAAAKRWLAAAKKQHRPVNGRWLVKT